MHSFTDAAQGFLKVSIRSAERISIDGEGRAEHYEWSTVFRALHRLFNGEATHSLHWNADGGDDFPRSVAALRRADVVLVNPVRDGLNLVAKEAAVVNERDGVLVLSPEAGAWAELADAVVGCDPFDVTGTSDALHRALCLDGGPRRDLSARWREAATARTPADWLDDNLAAAT